MDPNANLEEQLRLTRHNITMEDALDLCDLVHALHEWITRGGFLPDAWARCSACQSQALNCRTCAGTGKSYVRPTGGQP